jgi:hypothetical protein
MTRRKKILFAQVAVVAAIPIVLYAYAEGPDATLAGVPGENTCAACHGGGCGTGSVTITFSNGMSYTPGVTQHLVVTITDNKARRWGFELTARQAGNTGLQAGTFARPTATRNWSAPKPPSRPKSGARVVPVWSKNSICLNPILVAG